MLLIDWITALDEIEDLLHALDEEHDRVVDRQDGFDGPADRIPESCELGQPDHNDLGDDPFGDRLDDDAFQITDPFQELAPDPGEAFGEEEPEKFKRLFQVLDHVFAQPLDQDRPDLPVGEAKELHDDGDDALEIELLGHFDSGALQGAEHPAYQASLDVFPDAGAELLDAFADGSQQVSEEADRILNNEAKRVFTLFQRGHHARGAGPKKEHKHDFENLPINPQHQHQDVPNESEVGFGDPDVCPEGIHQVVDREAVPEGQEPLQELGRRETLLGDQPEEPFHCLREGAAGLDVFIRFNSLGDEAQEPFQEVLRRAWNFLPCHRIHAEHDRKERIAGHLVDVRLEQRDKGLLDQLE